MNEVESAINVLRSCASGNRSLSVYPNEARNLVEHVDYLEAENERLRGVVERHEAAFRHICDLLNHKIGSDPLHVAAAQAVNDAAMLRLQENS